MKTAFTSNNKDNAAITTLLAVILFALISGVFHSSQTVAKHAVGVQKLDAIVVTASRAPDTVLDIVVITASRDINRV